MLAALLAASCGGSRPELPRPGESEPLIAYPEQAAVFLAEPAAPDTVALSWGAAGPVLVESVHAVPGEPLVPGDTIAVGRDSLVGLQIEMVRLQLSLASAGGASESDLAAIGQRLLQLETAFRRVLAAPVPGSLAWISIAPGDACPPGRSCAGLATIPENAFLVSAPEGAIVQNWPDSSGGAVLLHAAGDSAVYSGSAEPGDFVFEGSIGLPRGAILDSGLESFVVSAEGDTLRVERLCTVGETVTVTSDASLDAGVVVWAGGPEEWND